MFLSSAARQADRAENRQMGWKAAEHAHHVKKRQDRRFSRFPDADRTWRSMPFGVRASCRALQYRRGTASGERLAG